MSPDEIHACLTQAHPELDPKERHNPDGWSFFDGPAQRGINSNRIIRAVRNAPNAVTRLKLAVSSRLDGKEHELDFSGTQAELLKHVEAELQRYRNGAK